MLVTSIFSFSHIVFKSFFSLGHHNVFKSCLLQGLDKLRLCGKEFTLVISIFSFSLDVLKSCLLQDLDTL